MEEYPRAVEGETIEDRLQRLQADVRAAQPGHEAAAVLAAIVESSDDAIVSKSLQGIITTWNLSAERLFGYTAAEAVGRAHHHSHPGGPTGRRAGDSGADQRRRAGRSF